LKVFEDLKSKYEDKDKKLKLKDKDNDLQTVLDDKDFPRGPHHCPQLPTSALLTCSSAVTARRI